MQDEISKLSATKVRLKITGAKKKKRGKFSASILPCSKEQFMNKMKNIESLLISSVVNEIFSR